VPLQLIDLVGSNPFLTPRETERQLGIAYTTVVRAIIALEETGVLAKVRESKRNRVFCDRVILEILEEPARLVSETPATSRRSTVTDGLRATATRSTTTCHL